MRRLLFLFVPAIALAASEPIFDGVSLTGWVVEGPHRTFEVERGQIAVTGKGNEPNWLHTLHEYENFRLHFEYRLAQWGEAAVMLRAPRYGRPMQAGVSLYLAHDYHTNAALWSTGAIPGVRAPIHPPKPSFEEWHAVDVSLEGDRFTSSVDGTVVQDSSLAEDKELKYRLKKGFIEFPDLGYKYWLRNIRLEDLGGRTKFVEPLGSTLDEWDLRGSGAWQVRDGVLSAWSGDGVLYAPGEYRDFEFSLLVRPHDHVNSGVFLRGSPELKLSRGFEVQIYSGVDSVYPTGSIYNLARSNITADYEERWFLMQIVVEGSRCAVRVDGVTVAETERLPESLPKQGRIGLQFHSAGAWVEFRDMRVRPL
jgi:hypothetical protein